MKTNQAHSIWNFIGIADYITLAGVFAASCSIYASLSELFVLASVLILFSAFCDFIDGIVARKLRQESRFGGALDGFNDFLTYLLAVCVFAYSAGLSSIVAILCLCVFVVFGTMRLARYSVTGTVEGCYEGLPVSYIVVVLPLYFLLNAWQWPLELLLPIFVLPSFLMVSTIRIKKPFLQKSEPAMR